MNRNLRLVFIGMLLSSGVLGANASAKGSNAQARTMKINICAPQKVVIATLADNDTARDFLSLLPLTLTLTDYGKTEKISDLPRKLTTKGSPSGSDASVSDIAYYAPWGNLAIFLKDGHNSPGFVVLGK